MPQIMPMLWFDTEAEEAARFYTSIFPNSEITGISHYTDVGPREKGTVSTVDFTLDGQRHIALNGGPEFRFNEAISLVINCRDQEEVDHYWAKLTDGGEESACGWLKDRFGVSWQVVPAEFLEIVTGPDEGRRDRGIRAMLQMKKLDLGALKAAADAPPIRGSTAR